MLLSVDLWGSFFGVPNQQKIATEGHHAAHAGIGQPYQTR